MLLFVVQTSLVASRRVVAAVYWWGLAILLLSVPLRIAVSGTAAWQAFATAFVPR